MELAVIGYDLAELKLKTPSKVVLRARCVERALSANSLKECLSEYLKRMFLHHYGDSASCRLVKNLTNST